MLYSTEVKETAKRLFLRRCKAKEIQAQLNLPNIRIVYYWIRQGGWEDMLSDEEPLTAVGRRITLILDKHSTLTKGDLDELDRLTNVRERLLKQSAKPVPAPIGDQPADAGQPREGRRRERGERTDKGGGKREKKIKNDVSGLTEVDFLDKFIGSMYGYQKELFAAKQNPLACRIRNILKSRQVGLTYYFAGEAFMDAVLTGDNQIFLSASRAQSEIFRSYIIQFAQQWFGLELTGNPIQLSNGAELRFLSTNSSTAQGHHGHVYVDEYFWIRDFEKLNTVASAMATHKKWRKTYFSTPSAVTHQAYPFWSGEGFRNSKRGKKLAADWPKDKAIAQGTLCPDGQWRKIITIDDAIAGGCNLFDLAQLQLEYDEDKFEQLFRCKFIDSTMSAFSLSDLERCYSDLALWADYDPDDARPYGNSPVWLGYDPSRTREPPFRGAVVIGQNHAVNASEPILQRLVHIAMTKDGQTPQTKLLVEKLERMPVDRVSGFLIKATMKENIVMQTVREQVPVYEQKLLALPEIRTVRIAKNHAQLHALIDALVHVIPLKKHQVEAAHTEIQSMAKERQLAINADHPIVVEFWELYEYLNNAAGGLNHSRNDGLIAVNLNDFAKEAAEKRQKVPDLTELKRHLKTSKCPKFIETNRNVCSAWDVDAANKAKTVRCWIFQAA